LSRLPATASRPIPCAAASDDHFSLIDVMDAAELRRSLVLASPFKEGDLRVGGTRDDAVRRDARRALETCTLGAIAALDVVEDGVTEALARGRDRARAAELAGLTVAELRSVLLGAGGPAWVARHRDGLASEAIAAVVKVMDDAELATVARRLFNPLPARGGGVAIGAPSHFGSRIQPNSPSDDPYEVLFAVLEGLTYGCGDVILGSTRPATTWTRSAAWSRCSERWSRRSGCRPASASSPTSSSRTSREAACGWTSPFRAWPAPPRR
jgi:ethanolamine ammonia-lyase large subunit